MLLFNILNLVVVIILLVTFFLLCFWVFSGFNNKTRFTPIPYFLLEEIKKNLKIKDNSIVFNLGCGDGRVLFYLSQQNSKAKYIGVEDNTFLLLLARSKNWWNNLKQKNKIEIINKDFFKQDLSEATHIFTYLYPNIMDDLLPKLDEELKHGTHLISLNFQFTLKRPIAEIELPKKSYQPIKKIYIYEF